MFFLPSEKRSTLKGKNLLPMGANYFLLEDLFFFFFFFFLKRLDMPESKEEVTKVVSHVCVAAKILSVSRLLKGSIFLKKKKDILLSKKGLKNINRVIKCGI